jgi:hypothetical protein
VNSVGDGAASNSREVTPVAVVPSAPTLTSVTPGDGNATATFAAPQDDGGAPITSDEVSTVEGQNIWVPVTTTGSSPFTVTISGLTDDTLYSVVVRAVSSAGDSDASNSLDVTPVAAPVVASARTILTGTAIPGTFVPPFETPAITQLTFTTPTSDGGSPITGYEISADAGMSWVTLQYTAGSPNQASVFAGTGFGCGPGTTYFYEIRAETLAGDGAASAVFPVSFPGSCG